VPSNTPRTTRLLKVRTPKTLRRAPAPLLTAAAQASCGTKLLLVEGRQPEEHAPVLACAPPDLREMGPALASSAGPECNAPACSGFSICSLERSPARLARRRMQKSDGNRFPGSPR